MLFYRLKRLSIRTRNFLRVWAPTNILLDWFRAHLRPRTAIILVLLGLAYLAACWLTTALIEQGWPEWLYLLFFLFLWNAGKFLLFLPIEGIKALLRVPRRAAARLRTQQQHSESMPT